MDSLQEYAEKPFSSTSRVAQQGKEYLQGNNNILAPNLLAQHSISALTAVPWWQSR